MMRYALGFCFVFWFGSCGWAQTDPLYTKLAEAVTDADFNVQGEYVGNSRALQVIALGDGEFEGVVYNGGLPGAGWNGTPPTRLELDGDGVRQLVESNRMQRVERKSPTLGKKPPAGAVVLFDGTPNSLTQHWKPGAKITDDGWLTEGATSLDTFQDYVLHVEFRTPFRPQARGQQRGNSGVYHQGRYETQVLDSFGLAGKDNEAGGIYSIRDPDLNMCFPPLTWQTYDCEFTAAKFDESGKKVANARLTVRLNGVVVQQDVELPKSTTAAPVKEGPQPGPIYIQGHGNPVRFRNIWVQPRDVAKEARRPIVPGFERFFVTNDNQASLGGRVLLTELGCAACHATPQLALSPKQAPILDVVGSRIRPDYLLEFIEHPHLTKPGTTMPDMLGQLPEAERRQAATAIASFLLTTGTVTDQYGNPKAVSRGRNLFHTVGCTACHAPSDETRVPLGTTVPLAGVGRKYTLASLVSFLRNPHAVRPGGRMPSFGLEEQPATDVATYLLSDVIVGDAAENMHAAFYNGNWDKLPDFDELQPMLVTKTYGLDLKASGKRNLERFGARFESSFTVPRDANYRFHLASDDGSRLSVDGEVVVDNDGVHPMNWKTGRVRLATGTHSIRIDYFEQGGEEGVEVEIEGGGLPRTPIETLASLDPQGARRSPVLETNFVGDETLVEQGRALFVSTGCAACHQLRENDQPIAAMMTAPALTALRTGGPNAAVGCLAEQPRTGLPNYELSTAQRAAIEAALTELREAPEDLSAAQSLHVRLASLNCYACHRRGGLGGPERSRDGLFKTTMQEMGDEGRLPPPLDGVGDKLKPEYLKNTLQAGADERPYMLVNMPGFGNQHADVADALLELDQKTDATITRVEEPLDQVKAAGRLLAGNKGLSCIKCHTAGGKGTGIRAIDLQRMTTRLREDWFHRYLMTPTAYRPGTRMPSSFPDGKSVLPELYGGQPSSQIDALWQYLLDGSDARLPIGAEQNMIELAANEKPVLYRNFIEGLTPRGIGVGYPQGLNLAWDANDMSLRLLWKGAFIDAGRHWVGRGPGNQDPLGDAVLDFERSAPVAILPSPQATWPTSAARNRGYRFLGYRLNAVGQPTFRYRMGQLEVEDTPMPAVDAEGRLFLRREFRISGRSPGLVLRLASGKKITPAGQWMQVDDQYTVKISGGQTPTIIHDETDQVRCTVDLRSGSAVIIQEVRW